ncbi:MAG: UPF0182 family protein [Nocardioides sp.]
MLAHMRYPEDMFKAQRFMLASYHVTDADDFYQGNDKWEIPKDPNADTEQQPPYRLSVATPSGGEEPIFSLTSVYTPVNRENLAAFVSVDADASLDSYGTMRVLRLGSSSQIPGPGQIANQIGSDEGVKAVLFPFTNNNNATVKSGNLLTLPVGGGLLYVQPLYTQRTTGDGNYPVLRFVAVSFGENVGVGVTLGDAISDLLDVQLDDEGAAAPGDGGKPGTGEPGDPVEPLPGTVAEQIRALLTQAAHPLRRGRPGTAVRRPVRLCGQGRGGPRRNRQGPAAVPAGQGQLRLGQRPPGRRIWSPWGGHVRLSSPTRGGAAR